jgi:DnaJ like chaperone protein
MRVAGKVVGGGVGFFFAGPFGALAGIALGHQLFDRPPREYFGVPMSNRELRNSVFFAATFAMLGKLAKADGDVSEEEIDALKSIVRDQFQLSRQSAQFAFDIFEESVADEEPFETHARAFYSEFSDAPEALATMLEIMLVIAYADFEYDESEEALIQFAASIFGLDDEYLSILKMFRTEPDNLEHCYDLLDSQYDDDDATIRARYEALRHEHDPELLLEEGVPKELIAVAEKNLKQIDLAFEHILNSRIEP